MEAVVITPSSLFKTQKCHSQSSQYIYGTHVRHDTYTGSGGAEKEPDALHTSLQRQPNSSEPENQTLVFASDGPKLTLSQLVSSHSTIHILAPSSMQGSCPLPSTKRPQRPRFEFLAFHLKILSLITSGLCAAHRGGHILILAPPSSGVRQCSGVRRPCPRSTIQPLG